MTTTNTHFDGEQAPCGRSMSGERRREQDDECLVSDDLFYSCGCRVFRHEYHDGSLSRRVVRCDGKVLEDDLTTEYHA